LIPGFCAFIFQTNFDHITVTIPVAATAQVRLLAQTVSCLLPWGEPADKYCSSAANCAGKELCGEAPSGLRAYDTMLTPQLENSSPRASALKRARPGDLRLVCDTPTCFSQPRLLSCGLGQTPWPVRGMHKVKLVGILEVGLEPTISSLGGRRLIHQATRAVIAIPLEIHFTTQRQRWA
jgi:hypothetical protein